jgi:hypothetical protein
MGALNYVPKILSKAKRLISKFTFVPANYAVKHRPEGFGVHAGAK